MARIADPFDIATPARRASFDAQATFRLSPTRHPLERIVPLPVEAGIPPVKTTLSLYHVDEVAGFCRVRDEFGQFSNFARCSITAAGRTWRSSEALYQALRFPHSLDLQSMILNAPDPFKVKEIVRENDGHTRKDWGTARISAMAWTLGLKREQVRSFEDTLLKARGRTIVEISKGDDFWGAKPCFDRLSGRNVLGQLLELCAAGRTFAPPVGSILLGREVS